MNGNYIDLIQSLLILSVVLWNIRLQRDIKKLKNKQNL